MIKNQIDKIGVELVKCALNCEGISCDILKGILPRCLIYDERGIEENGVIIVGLNPGMSKKHEREFYKGASNLYEKVCEYWFENIYVHKYYKYLYELCDALDLDGPILWTELVKCEGDASKIPMETFRVCSNTYLKKELDYVPQNWPILAIGKKAFEITAIMFPKKTIYGVPHPTGSWGYFPKLYKENSKQLNSEVQEIVKNSAGKAVWIKTK